MNFFLLFYCVIIINYIYVNMSCFLYNVWDKKKELNDVHLTLQGDAVAGMYSGFYIKQWKIMLEAGLQTAFTPQNIFISHTHSDHIEKLPMILTGFSKKVNIYVPRGTKSFIIQYLNAHHNMTKLQNRNKFSKEENLVKIIEVDDGDEFDIVSNQQKLLIKVFATDHSIKSCGYAFSTYKSKRKPEYENKTGPELKELALSGVELSNKIPINVLIYTGDTRCTIYQNKNIKIDWNSYKYIITECTYINGLLPHDLFKKSVKDEANKRGHSSYDEILEEICTKISNPKFILVHMSLRHSKEEIKKFFIEGKQHPQIIPWID